jgi:hypothetical protein
MRLKWVRKATDRPITTTLAKKYRLGILPISKVTGN